jgi:predicted RNA binding protein YcfA (HicA-like mRNA interferase family)
MPLSGKQLVKMLKKDGWTLERVNGSHHIMAKGNKTMTVPVHANKSLGKGIESKLLKQAGLKK